MRSSSPRARPGCPTTRSLRRSTRAHGGAPFWDWPAPLREREPRALDAARVDARARSSTRIEREQYAFHLQWQRLRAHARGAACACSATCPSTSRPPRSRPGCTAGLFQLDARGRPGQGRRRAAGLLLREGTDVGQPAVRLARARGAGLRLVARAHGAQLARLDLAAPGSFPRASRPTGRCRRARPMRAPAPGSPRRAAAARAPAGRVSRPAARRRGPRRHHRRRAARSCASSRCRACACCSSASTASRATPTCPYRHVRDCVAYTGTHDNDTTLGWYASLDAATRARVDFYCAGGAMPEALMRAALDSVAELAVVPMQDLLGLRPRRASTPPERARATGGGGCPPVRSRRELAARCAHLNTSFGRS